MPSPFPGMDPYLENPAFWPGIHNRLIAALDEYLSPRLLPRYYISLEERVYVTSWPEPDFGGIPDLAVVASRAGPPEEAARPQAGSSAGGRAGIQVLTATVPVPERVSEWYLEIREPPGRLSGGDVVTVIEILSPWNKRPGEGRREYEGKRMRTLGTATHLVEIDLLRAGEPPPFYLRDRPSANGVPGDYRILIARGGRRSAADLYAFTVRAPIPPFPLPLREGDQEPLVDLQSVLNVVYDRGGYQLRVDYREEAVPPLRLEDAAWADALLHARGLC